MATSPDQAEETVFDGSGERLSAADATARALQMETLSPQSQQLQQQQLQMQQQMQQLQGQQVMYAQSPYRVVSAPQSPSRVVAAPTLSAPAAGAGPPARTMWIGGAVAAASGAAMRESTGGHAQGIASGSVRMPPAQQAAPVAAAPPLQALLQQQLAAAQQVLTMTQEIATYYGYEPPGVLAMDGLGSPGSQQPPAAKDDAGTLAETAELQQMQEEQQQQLQQIEVSDGQSTPKAANQLRRRSTVADHTTPLLANGYRTGAAKLKKRVDLLERERSMKAAEAEHSSHIHYHSGACQALLQNPRFESLTAVMVILSVIALGIETDLLVGSDEALDAGTLLGISIADNIFCTFFLFEILVRLAAYKVTSTAFTDINFLFDGFLVVMMMRDTWLQPLDHLIYQDDSSAGGRGKASLSLRTFRIIRIIRATRFAKTFPELLVVLKGLFYGLKALAATLFALGFCVYVFAIAFTTMLAGTEAVAGSFDNLPQAMNFLFLAAITSIDKAFIGKMATVGWLYWALYLLYLLIANLAILKMMTGVLVKVVDDVGKKTEEHATASLMSELVAKGDRDGTNSLTLEEFDALLEEDQLIHGMLEVGVDIMAFVEFMRPNWAAEGSMQAHELVRFMLQFRGKKPATTSDIMMVHMSLADLKKGLDAGEEMQVQPYQAVSVSR